MILDETRDALHRGYKWRLLTPAQCGAIRKARADGVSAVALAREYGVHKRTIYRAAERARDTFRVIEIDGWRAEFAITSGGPIRMTAWYAT